MVGNTFDCFKGRAPIAYMTGEQKVASLMPCLANLVLACLGKV